jgi:hypothetical protein
MIYQIKDWNIHYENNKSREREKCSFCCIPNKQDGLGYGMLMREENGEALYGAFVAVVLICSKQTCGERVEGDGEKSHWKTARDGWLTDNGLPSGCPLTARQLSVKCQFSEKTIQAMLTAVSSNEIGWIVTSARQVPAKCPPSAPERTKERREGKEENGSELRGLRDLKILPQADRLLNLISFCREVLGEEEISKNHKRWLEKAEKFPDKLTRVISEVRCMVLENKIKTTPSRAAEDLWKRLK